MKGLDINVQDNKLSTPLHWSIYTGSDMAFNYILSMKPNLNPQDIQGYTPIHIAVVSAEKLESTRYVKSLLIKGASRETKDGKGRTPIELLEINGDINPSMKVDLLNSLQLHSYWECLMIRVPLIPMK